MAGGGKPSMPKPDQLNRVEYAEKASQAIAADVRMFSGCKDEQTSADVISPCTLLVIVAPQSTLENSMPQSSQGLLPC